MICAFHDNWQRWHWPACYGGLHRHHVISKSKLAKNKQARKLVEGKYAHIFLQPVCMGHNCSKYADTWYARRYLLKRYPEAEVRAALEEIRRCYTGDYPELSYEALCEVKMNKLQEVEIFVNTKVAEGARPEIEATFWRRMGGGVRYHGYNNLSAKNFKNLCIALNGWHTTEILADERGISMQFDLTN